MEKEPRPLLVFISATVTGLKPRMNSIAFANGSPKPTSPPSHPTVFSDVQPSGAGKKLNACLNIVFEVIRSFCILHPEGTLRGSCTCD